MMKEKMDAADAIAQAVETLGLGLAIRVVQEIATQLGRTMDTGAPAPDTGLVLVAGGEEIEHVGEDVLGQLASVIGALDMAATLAAPFRVTLAPDPEIEHLCGACGVITVPAEGLCCYECDPAGLSDPSSIGPVVS